MIGLSGGAESVREALLAEPRVRLVAVADQDAKVAASQAEATGAEAYTDCRSLIVEQKLDALFVATPHFATHGYLKLAAANGVPVWKQTPPGRRFDEALTLARVFERAGNGGCPLVIARPWSAEPALQQARKTLTELGRPFLAEARVFCCRPEDLDWRGDSESAGAGVLLHEGFEAIDTIVHWMGRPTEVYAATARASRPQTRYPYDTEDTAAMILRYADGALASLTCCWTSGPPVSELTIRSTGGTIRIDPKRVTVLDRAGQPMRAALDRAPNPYTHPIRAFLDGHFGGQSPLASLARDHLWTMAVMETAYLSSRTGEAELPAKWFEVLSAEEKEAPPPPREPDASSATTAPQPPPDTSVA